MAVNNALTNETRPSQTVEYRSGNTTVKISPAMVRDWLVTGDAEKVTNQEIVMFINLCKYQGLNPFLREAYLIKYGSQPAALVTGKAAFEKRAARCEKFQGFRAGVVVYDAEHREITRREGTIVLPHETLYGGWADVYVDGYHHPVHAEVALAEYIGKKSDGTVNKQWASKPATMIRKVAKVHALREAFPDNFQGMYTPEEMQIDEPLPETPIEPQSSYAEEIPPAMPPEQEITEDFERILEGQPC